MFISKGKPNEHSPIFFEALKTFNIQNYDMNVNIKSLQNVMKINTCMICKLKTERHHILKQAQNSPIKICILTT